jgi:uncharacterized protein RhaS with RHS repeats
LRSCRTWWRKYGSLSGRWTSPDPLGGSIGDPQSFNAYSYAGNDPVNLIDPSGLKQCFARFEVTTTIHTDGHVDIDWKYLTSYCVPTVDDFPFFLQLGDDPQNERLAAARAELERRLGANHGENPCAKAFGGFQKALKALNETNFTFDSTLDANAQTIGTHVIINSGPNQAFMQPPGSTYSFDLATASKLRNRPGGGQIRDVSFSSLPLRGVTAAAFLLAHELGHRRHIYGDNYHDGTIVDNAINNMKIWKACFSEAKPIPQ